MTVSTALPAYLLLTPAQCRAARGLLGWTQSDLARETKLSKTSIAQFETGTSECRSNTRRSIIETFTHYGIEFLPPNGVNKLPAYCRIFNDDAALAREWPDFLQSLTQMGHRHITLFNWPDFADEFTKQTGIEPIVLSADAQLGDRAAQISQWLIMPILGSAYRLALYQATQTK